MLTQHLENTKNIYEKNLLQTQLEIQEQTFLDISREIHDNIGLSLTLAKLQLNTIDPLNPDKISESVNSSVQLIGKAIHDLSDISKSLNSETIKTQGLYNTLKVETERISYSGKIDIQFATEGEAVFLDAQKELVLYRIAQEALNNILKHASATRVWLILRYTATEFMMSVKDNGKGFEANLSENQPVRKMTAGLANMRIRAGSINGSCKIESSSGNGTTISIIIAY